MGWFDHWLEDDIDEGSMVPSSWKETLEDNEDVDFFKRWKKPINKKKRYFKDK